MTTTTSRVTKTGAIKLGFAALATAALTIGGLTPAYAADVQLGPADIAGFENGDESQVGAGYNYDQWHIGNTENTEAAVEQSLEFGDCSVTFLPPVERTVTQLLKGYPIDARPSTVADIRAAIESASVDVESGSVTLQFPFFAQTNGEVEPQWLGTWRNEIAFTGGVGSITGGTGLVNTGDGVTETLDEFIAYLEEFEWTDGDAFGWPELLGIGITGQPDSVVNSMSFGGDTYYFGTGDCLPEVPVDPTDPTDPVDPETPTAPKKPVAVETGL